MFHARSPIADAMRRCARVRRSSHGLSRNCELAGRVSSGALCCLGSRLIVTRRPPRLARTPCETDGVTPMEARHQTAMTRRATSGSHGRRREHISSP